MNKPMSGRRTALLWLLGAFALAQADVVIAQSEWTSTRMGKLTLINLYTSIGTHGSSYCEEGSFVVGLEIRSGLLVDGMRVQCAKLGANGEHRNYSQSQSSKFVGNPGGGQPSTVTCPSGKVVTSFRGRAGEFIDRVQFACRPWKQDGGAYGSASWMPAKGGNGGESFGPVECPLGMGLTRIDSMNAGSYIGYFRMTCRSQPAAPATMSAQSAGAQGSLQPQGRPAGASVPVAAQSVAQPAGARQIERAPVSAAQPPATPAVKMSGLSRVSARGVDTTVSIAGENFIIFVNGRPAPVTKVEIGGAPVTFKVDSASRITAVIPQAQMTRLNLRAVPVVLTHGKQRINGQFALR